MKKVKAFIYYILLTILFLLIPVFAFAMINTRVSIKYETAESGLFESSDCISVVSEENLCQTIWIIRGLILLCTITIIMLLIFRKRILK